MSKTFIIGLPRTGTTSLCAACVELGLTTAHTAYTIESFSNAHVIADTPVFNDYALLYQRYPDAKFIYLERDLAVWLPSISKLLRRMSGNLFSDKGGFNDTIKRCFLNTFSGLDYDNLDNFDFLTTCYETHKAKAIAFFEDTQALHVFLNVSQPHSFAKLCDFLGVDAATTEIIDMPKLNVNGKVTAWNDLKHPLKVSSTRMGKVDKDADLLTFMQSV
ncbi:sulfotransferase [Pseudoalteromonas phenolica]|uniref:sulfotransferase n=1 Tax=Pseudoalteromonas phenolica TaxID=161398 RepID=UPI00110B2965|nr:sulfotransferase [Pseudoalteromonas phenolica]TMO56758.1 sulfotransferase family protein [Pseudoalteromonas phenolica]